jgi:hypothetical protein
MIAINNVEQGTEEWKAARIGKFTGSNAYKLLGKFGALEYAKAIESSFKGNFYTKRGHILEDEALELYETIYSTEVLRAGFITNDQYPSCLYSPDGVDGAAPADGVFAEDAILLEVKCFGEVPHMEIVNGRPPVKILAQIHFGMMISGIRQARLIGYNPELEPEIAFFCMPVEYDEAITANFKRILKGANSGTSTQ